MGFVYTQGLTATAPPPAQAQVHPVLPKEWDSWPDRLGNFFRAGDWIAYASGSGRMVIGIVEKINRLYPGGHEILWHTRDQGDPQLRADWVAIRYGDPQKQVAYDAWQASIQDTYSPACTVLIRPHEYDCYAKPIGNRRTIKFYGAIIKIPPP
jgi:hypothetical protein